MLRALFAETLLVEVPVSFLGTVLVRNEVGCPVASTQNKKGPLIGKELTSRTSINPHFLILIYIGAIC